MAERRTVTFPLQLAPTGTTATVPYLVELEQLIEQLLFTDPGERLNRPTLGAGVTAFVFGAMSEELVSAAEFLVQSNLQQWLGSVIKVQAVSVTAVESSLEIFVTYQPLAGGSLRTAVFRR
jgi:phage baseplate assembly protein W